MISHLRRTKIIATFGPAITQKIWNLKALEDPNNAEMVQKAIDTTERILIAGVNTARLNFSHGTHDEQLVRIKLIRDVAKKLKRPVSIMLDTKGPEIRVFQIANEGHEYLQGQDIIINCLERHISTPNSFSILDSTGTYNMAKDVKINNLVLVDDGKLSLLVIDVDVVNGLIYTKALNNHFLKTNKRINLPNAQYSIPFLSEKDIADIKFACANKLNYIAASFVNNKQNILDIRKIIKENNCEHIKLIAKIETFEAIENIDEIIEVSDGIMIARGDLGLELPFWEVPYWGKYIIKKCRYANTPVIMATQMLDSLEKNLIPTRAEASDVFWAVELGIDSTMLSGESAQGLFPINAVEVMSKIDRQSEIFFDYKRSLDSYFPNSPYFTSAKGILAAQIAKHVMPPRQVINESFNFQAIAVFDNDQQFLDILSCARPAARILVFTTCKNIYNGNGISYGISPILVNDLEHAKKHYAEYVNAYYDAHIQTKSNISLTRKTLVVIDGVLKEIDASTTHDKNIKVEFIHRNN